MRRSTYAGVVCAALGVAACGCTSFGSSDKDTGGAPIVVDEAAPRYRSVGLGSTTTEVERVLGPGDTSAGFAPAHRLPAEVAVPLAIPNPVGAEHERPEVRRYEDSAFLFLHDRAYAMMLTSGAIETARGVGIGDSIDEVRRRYDAVRCAHVAGGESAFGGTDTYPSCQARIRPTRFVWFGGDPIRSLTFYSRDRLD
jgi:hypothetical protein